MIEEIGKEIGDGSDDPLSKEEIGDGSADPLSEN